jgi:hypothetical protein
VFTVAACRALRVRVRTSACIVAAGVRVSFFEQDVTTADYAPGTFDVIYRCGRRRPVSVLGY